MRRENYLRNLLVLVMMVLVAGSTALVAQRRTAKKKPVIRRGTIRKTVPVPKTYAVTANTRIRARMNDTLDNERATVRRPVAVHTWREPGQLARVQADTEERALQESVPAHDKQTAVFRSRGRQALPDSEKERHHGGDYQRADHASSRWGNHSHFKRSTRSG